MTFCLDDNMLRRLVLWAAFSAFSVRAFLPSRQVCRPVSYLSAASGNSTRSSLSNIGSDSIMSRLKRQAQMLRTEVDSLAASDERTNRLKRNAWEGIVRDDVKIDRTNLTNLTTTPSAPMTNASDLPIAILSPRASSEDPVSKIVSAVLSSEDSRKNSSESIGLVDKWMEEDKELKKVYNYTALPDLEEIIKDLPFVMKLIVRGVDKFSKRGTTVAEALERKLFVTAVALECKDLWLRDDETSDDETSEGRERAVEAIERRVEELRDMITIGSLPPEHSVIALYPATSKNVIIKDTPFNRWLSESADASYILKDYDLDDVLIFAKIASGFAKYLSDEGIDFSTLSNDQATLYLLRYVQEREESEGTFTAESVMDNTLSGATPNASSPLENKIAKPSDIDVADDNEEEEEEEVDLNSLLTSLVEDVRGSAEGIVVSYFDEESRYTGDVFTKESAGRLQDSMLRDVFDVNAVSNKSGAVIFFGSPVGPTTDLASKLSEKYAASPYKESFKYILLRNEYFPELKSVEEMAIDAMFKSSPAVIVYPATWNSTVTEAIRDPIRKAFRSFLISCAILTSTVFATDSLNNLPTSEIDASYIPLTFSALTLQTLGALSEVTVAALKGFNTSVLLVPSLRLGSWGPRMLYTSMPKNRNDLFDAAFAGFLVTFLASFAALVAGLDITAHGTPSDIAAFPCISASILKSNTLIAELFQWKFPGIFDAPIEENLVHMHWLAFAGLIGLISSVFQLIPLDNSTGSKMCFSILGIETSTVVNGFASFFRLAFLLPFVFNFGTEVNEVGLKALLVDFFFASQFAGNNRVILIDY